MVQNLVKQADKSKVKTTVKEKKPLVFRKERKYAISDVSIDVVENYVRSHPAMFSKPFPPRQINNIYFDTPKFQNYMDNIVGAKQRRKYRIRWYGEQYDHVEKPVLEIKIKEGLAGAKKYFPLAPFDLEPGFSEHDVRKMLDQSDIPTEAREALHHFVPTLLNRYQRKYYLSADRRFRVTLDTNVTYTLISRYQNYFMRSVIDRDNVIMELKYDIKDDAHVDWISDYFPFRMTKNSKYVNGVDSLDAWL